jgi:RimJ/RimL family protein N-acetyltransferase
MTLSLRDATEEDVDLLYEWRNEPATRESSFQTAVIDIDSHRQWFARKLSQRDRTRIWILTESGEPAGQVRYDRDSDVAEISFSIDSRFRGRGLGSEILRLSAPRACSELRVKRLRGVVKANNPASIAAFDRAGFQRESESIVNGEQALVFTWSCAAT